VASKYFIKCHPVHIKLIFWSDKCTHILFKTGIEMFYRYLVSGKLELWDKCSFWRST